MPRRRPRGRPGVPRPPGPAMTIENSPRAMSGAPARARPRRPITCRAAAHHPDATLVAPVTSASAAATPSADGSVPGSTWSAKKRKNVAAKRSRNGRMSAEARSDTEPESATPTRNAPTAAETRNRSAIPATSSVVPSTVRSRTSSDGLESHRLTTGPWRNATKSTTATRATASVTDSTRSAHRHRRRSPRRSANRPPSRGLPSPGSTAQRASRGSPRVPAPSGPWPRPPRTTHR